MALNLLTAFCYIFLGNAHASDETWLTLSVKKSLELNHYVTAEYIRRDSGSLFKNKFRDLYRLTYGHQWDQFHFLIGAAVADYEHSSVEYRLVQYGIFNFKSKILQLSGFIRIGVEERRFESDNHIYWRNRAKVFLLPLSSLPLGPIIYNETFFGFSGKEKFQDGFNENRLGLGIRGSIFGMDSSVTFVKTHIKNINRQSKDVEWLQTNLNYNF